MKKNVKYHKATKISSVIEKGPTLIDLGRIAKTVTRVPNTNLSAVFP